MSVANPSHPLDIHVVQVVLYKLNSGVEVSLVELIRDVPAQRTVLAPFLDRGVQKGYGVEHRPPLGHITHIQQVLTNY